uniref:Uncharacterized protein MANES_10G057400 n=1 Tax=Rhizophora mucronata TaxID=61149 RepID=A0A2P2KF92_RHIMU
MTSSYVEQVWELKELSLLDFPVGRTDHVDNVNQSKE